MLTCGGAFDPAIRYHVDHVIAFSHLNAAGNHLSQETKMSTQRLAVRGPGTRGWSGLLCVAVLALTAACGSSAGNGTASPVMAQSAPAMMSPEPSRTETPAAGAPAAQEAVIMIKDYKFTVPTSVPAGATVKVVNGDSMAHSVTATAGGGFDITIAGGATATFKAPAMAGSYDFDCMFHGNMKGVLVVS